jgi:hypothetical protein
MRSLREAYLALNGELVATEETHDDTTKNESCNGNSSVSSDCSRGEVHGEKRRTKYVLVEGQSWEF